ncbi:MAG TPA: 23S rRNA (guanosine(2251)-2'-O)-methyltransferase RlmB [Ignavibacteria bacterium]|nr:23S rRNA (guanosine(2251)-2'-O)-methyltransferase RlmB [Ignavibacteria bacterium]HMR00488.1 23S rRNA (guanosine(2251)-2'-O)-methyltransferase RlmB [Ignavibacteria bacterium]
MLVIGRNPVTESLRSSPETILKIVLLDTVTDNKIKEIERLAKSKNIDIAVMPKSHFEKILDKNDKSDGISQGIYAEVKDFEYSRTTEILKSLNSKEKTTLLILDEIQDPHNFGAIIRTAVSAGADGIIISDKNSVKVNHTVIKSSSGATNYIKISKEPNIYKTIEVLQSSGYKIIGTVLKTDEEIYNFRFPDKCALVFGSEGEGLRKNIINLCDNLVKIPIAGKIDSLNVSVSAGVFLYEILRQRNFSKE